MSLIIVSLVIVKGKKKNPWEILTTTTFACCVVKAGLELVIFLNTEDAETNHHNSALNAF